MWTGSGTKGGPHAGHTGKDNSGTPPENQEKKYDDR